MVSNTMRPGSWCRALGLACLLGVLASPLGCTRSSVRLDGRLCEDGQCIEGYRCHPELNICGGIVRQGCDDATAYCPSRTQAGDACPSHGAFLPCSDVETGCARGCRTCGEDLRWSECSPGECQLGHVTSCTSCTDDCTVRVANAEPVCNTSTSSTSCDYVGSCSAGAFDVDGLRSNGCECVPSNDGIERCDGIDNDCDGSTDEGVANCGCTSGAPVAESCDGRDNDCDGAIDEDFPCKVGDVRDCDSGAGPTSGRESCASCVWSGVCLPKQLAPPANPIDFDATDGEYEATTLTFTMPSAPVTECVVRRSTIAGAFPQSHMDGVAVGAAQTGSGGRSLVDTGLTNGTTYRYAVFCRNGSSWNDELAAGANTAAAVPIDLVRNFGAATGQDGVVPMSFDMPAGAQVCKLMRKTGSLPANPNDGTQVGGDFTPSSGPTKSYADHSVSNGTTYGYAVFCRADSSYRNSTVTAGLNAATATPQACMGGTVTLSEVTPTCNALSTGAANELLMAVQVVGTNCPHALTSITFTSDPRSSTNTTGASNDLVDVKLLLDDGDDVYDAGDAQQGGTQQYSADAVTFSGLDVSLPVGTSRRLYLVATAQASGVGKYYAAQIGGTTSFTVADPSVTRALETTPLVGLAHPIVSGLLCTGGGSDSTDLGLGSLPVAAVKTVRGPGDKNQWANGTGDEAGWTSWGDATNSADCDLETHTVAAGSQLEMSDKGRASLFLHIDTGVPLGLRVCDLTMRVYSSRYRPDGTCGSYSFVSMATLYFWSYDGATTVATPGVDFVTSEVRKQGPSLPSCPTYYSNYVDVSLGSLYDSAASAPLANFEVRFVVDDGGGSGLDSDGNKSIPLIPELYVRVPP